MDMDEFSKKLTELTDQLGVSRTILEGLRDDWQDYFDAQSKKWQQSDAGEECKQLVDDVSDHIDSLEDIETELMEIAKRKLGEPGPVEEDDD